MRLSGKKEEDEPEKKDEQEDKDKEDLEDEDLDDLIRPEIFTLNIPAVLEILFGLFLFFVAIMYIMSGWSLRDSDTDTNVANVLLYSGTGYLILTMLSFLVAYGLILKKKFAPFLGFFKGLFLIGFFAYSTLDYRRLAQTT